MGHAAVPLQMIAATIDITAQRLGETEAAIAEQRRLLDRLKDPSSRATAARTLGALEDMLLIMKRTSRPVVAR